MLSDRNYMRGGRGYRRPGPSIDPVTCVFLLIAINIVVYLIFSITPNKPVVITIEYQGQLARMEQYREYLEFGLSWWGLKKFRLWQLITYMFMHAGFWHLAFNMWALYLFGSVVAPVLGTGRFLAMYFISGICGAVLYLAFNYYSLPFPLVGASGGVFGITLAAAMLYPDMRIMLLFPPIPMTMKTMAIVFIALEIFLQFTGAQGGVAHLAHLGGVAGAYFYLKIFYRKHSWDPLDFLKKKKTIYTEAYKPKGWSIGSFNPGEGISQKELDRILDKISATGINSLSEEEMDYLKKAREEMKNQ